MDTYHFAEKLRSSQVVRLTGAQSLLLFSRAADLGTRTHSHKRDILSLLFSSLASLFSLFFIFLSLSLMQPNSLGEAVIYLGPKKLCAELMNEFGAGIYLKCVKARDTDLIITESRLVRLLHWMSALSRLVTFHRFQSQHLLKTDASGLSKYVDARWSVCVLLGDCIVCFVDFHLCLGVGVWGVLFVCVCVVCCMA